MRVVALLPYAVGTVAIGAVLASFSQSASPYVTISEARRMVGDRLHLSGTLVPGTVRQNIIARTQEFSLRDKNGAVVRVVHRGERVSLDDATTVVAVGKLKDGVFASDQILVKCPSRYEAKEGAKKGARPS